MLFNSLVFIQIFLPVALIGWFLLNRLKSAVPAKIFIVGMSLWFYAFYNVSFLWILLASIVFNYGLSLLMGISPQKKAWVKKALFAFALIGNIGSLFYFKYLNFFVDNCNFFFHADISIEKIAFPLGISFFTFRQIAFITDCYKGETPKYQLLDYVFFITFFPMLVAGPIVRHDNFIPQLSDGKVRRITWDNMYRGFSLFCLGLGKKVLIADSLAVLVNAEYNNIPWLDMPTAWCTIWFYMMELYFDFSGYSDMARGVGRMFGFEIAENFDSPFKAESVKDFWKRWHITLTAFLTKYVYIPLGGNRKGKTRQCINLVLVFLVSGIWHGAAWTFVVWGLMHALAEVFETLFPKVRFKLPALNKLWTFVYVTLAFSIFRADSLTDAAMLWKRLFSFEFQGKFVAMCNQMALHENYALRKLLEMVAPALVSPMFVFTFVILAVVSVIAILGRKAEEWIARYGNTVRGALFIATVFVWSFISLSEVKEFLYFNF